MEYRGPLDGKATQVIDRRDVPISEMSDSELLLIASGGSSRRGEILLFLPVRFEIVGVD